MISIKATIFYERKFWVGTFERTDKEGYSVARHIFGGEPTDPQIHEFVLNEYHKLNFGEPKEFDLVIKRMNPKRLKREAKKEMERAKETGRSSTHAQDYMREELEKNKKKRKQTSSQEKRDRKDEQFAFKKAKRQKKHKGH